MPISTDIVRTQQNMTEKLDWAARSVLRMNDAKSKKDAVAVQDHFWSFLHASRLVWFYLGEFIQTRPNFSRTAGEIMDCWTASHLSAPEQTVWGAIADLRTQDVHTRPVETEEQQTTSLAVRDDKLRVRDGKLLAVKIVKYNVSFDGDELDAIDLATKGVGLLRRFIADFPQLV